MVISDQSFNVKKINFLFKDPYDLLKICRCETQNIFQLMQIKINGCIYMQYIHCIFINIYRYTYLYKINSILGYKNSIRKRLFRLKCKYLSIGYKIVRFN